MMRTIFLCLALPAAIAAAWGVPIRRDARRSTESAWRWDDDHAGCDWPLPSLRVPAIWPDEVCENCGAHGAGMTGECHPEG